MIRERGTRTANALFYPLFLYYTQKALTQKGRDFSPSGGFCHFGFSREVKTRGFGMFYRTFA